MSMSQLEVSLIRIGLLCLLTLFWLGAAVPIACGIGWFVDWVGLGAECYAAIGGFAWSKWRRQCEDEDELERSFPIARLV